MSGMLLQVIARPDAQLIAAAARHSRRAELVTVRIAGWALIGASVLLGDPLNYPLLLAGIVVALMLPVLWVARTVRSSSSQPETTYEITDAGVAHSNVHSRQAYPWETLSQVTKLPGQLVFGVGGGRFLPMPTAGLTAWQVEEVLSAASSAGLPVRRAL